MTNLIFTGPSGVGKYSQSLKIIEKYSPSKLKYEKKIQIPLSKDEVYMMKISDIHFEVDMETLKVFQESIDIENAEVVDLYNTAKAKQPNVSDKIDAEIVEDVDDAPEKVLAS